MYIHADTLRRAWCDKSEKRRPPVAHVSHHSAAPLRTARLHAHSSACAPPQAARSPSSCPPPSAKTAPRSPVSRQAHSAIFRESASRASRTCAATHARTTAIAAPRGGLARMQSVWAHKCAHMHHGPCANGSWHASAAHLREMSKSTEVKSPRSSSGRHTIGGAVGGDGQDVAAQLGHSLSRVPVVEGQLPASFDCDTTRWA